MPPWWRSALVPVALIAASLYVTLRADGAAAFQYDRNAIVAGQGWRLLTAHLAHAGLTHWALNAAALAVIAAIYRRLAATFRFAAATLLLMAWVGLSLLLLRPDIDWYLGLSGVLHGVFAYCAARSAAAGEREHLVALALLAAKLGHEQIFGTSAATAALVGVPIVVDAHLHGAVGGLLLALLCGLSRRDAGAARR